MRDLLVPAVIGVGLYLWATGQLDELIGAPAGKTTGKPGEKPKTPAGQTGPTNPAWPPGWQPSVDQPCPPGWKLLHFIPNDGPLPQGIPICDPGTYQAAPDDVFLRERIEAAKKSLGNYLGVAPAQIQLVGTTEGTWNQPNLGCPTRPGTTPNWVQGRGWSIRLRAAGRDYEFRAAAPTGAGATNLAFVTRCWQWW